jgi:hypothetical protein
VLRTCTALVVCALFVASPAQAHLVKAFHKGESTQEKLQTIRMDIPHACASKDHKQGCKWLKKLARKLVRPVLSVHYYSAWMCIHKYEGSWTDTGDPYWGGLQMDRGFMSTYAPRWLLRKGLANMWTPVEQMWVAERAHRSRGFAPWPVTARLCGLL